MTSWFLNHPVLIFFYLISSSYRGKSATLHEEKDNNLFLLSSWCGTDMISKSSNAFNRSFTPFRFFFYRWQFNFCKLINIGRRSPLWSWHSRFESDIKESKQYVAITMKLSFCPQKILLIRPLAKSFPVMGVWCRCTLHGGGGEYGGGAWV